MLKHTFEKEQPPKRVVVMGSGGFVGGHVVSSLGEKGIPTTALSSAEVDLLSPNAAQQLAEHLDRDAVLVITSAKAPCKNHKMMLENIQMMAAVCDAIEKQPVAHLVYISSDAVYADSDAPLNEDSPQGADNPHGIMHTAREVMLASVAGETPLAFVRPTLIYGASDPHNGYGPNSFRRRAMEGHDIVLFGEGEELRDHVSVGDVAELVCRIVLCRSSGAINAVSGEVISFRALAEETMSCVGGAGEVKGSVRSGPMPHNGYRAFDASAIGAAFPDLKLTPPIAGIRAAIDQAQELKRS